MKKIQKKACQEHRVCVKESCVAAVAQLVEQGTENPRVGSSILSRGTIKKQVLRLVRSNWPYFFVSLFFSLFTNCSLDSDGRTSLALF